MRALLIAVAITGLAAACAPREARARIEASIAATDAPGAWALAFEITNETSAPVCFMAPTPVGRPVNDSHGTGWISVRNAVTGDPIYWNTSWSEPRFENERFAPNVPILEAPQASQRVFLLNLPSLAETTNVDDLEWTASVVLADCSWFEPAEGGHLRRWAGNEFRNATVYRGGGRGLDLVRLTPTPGDAVARDSNGRLDGADK